MIAQFLRISFICSIWMLIGCQEIMAQWSTYAPMPGTRWAHVCAEAAGRLYVAGGSTSPTWEYDPGTNTWATRASIPTARSYPAIASWNGMIYVLGGSVGAAWSGLNERYDPATNTWATMAPMPQVRTTTAAAAVNGRIYVMNGWNGTAMTAVDVYDIATNTWTTAAPAPTGRSHAKTAVVNNQIYLVGGYAGGWIGLTERYDPATNTWATMAPMPTGRYIHAVGAIGSTVYVAGGYAGSASNVLESFDTNTNTWAPEAPMPTSRYRTDGAVVNGCFHVLGGYNGSNLSTNEAFCSVILPVAMELEGWAQQGAIELEWSDPAVAQADFFEVERASPQGEFQSIGRVHAHATGDGNFAFSDPAPEAGFNRYRLRRVDLNGGIRYSPSIEVENDRLGAITIGWEPDQAQFRMKWTPEALSGAVNIDILDVSGRMATQFELDAARLHENSAVLPMEKPLRGIYLIVIRSGNRQIVKRLALGFE